MVCCISSLPVSWIIRRAGDVNNCSFRRCKAAQGIVPDFVFLSSAFGLRPGGRAGTRELRYLGDSLSWAVHSGWNLLVVASMAAQWLAEFSHYCWTYRMVHRPCDFSWDITGVACQSRVG